MVILFPRSSRFFYLQILLLAVGVSGAGAGTGETGPAPKGEGEITVKCGQEVFRVFTYKPAKFSSGPVFFVFHGMKRNAADYRDYAIPLAEKYRALVAAPLFDAERFPLQAYGRGKVANRETIFAYVSELIQAVLAREGGSRRDHYLIGHSAGGQLVGRYAAVETVKARRVVAANPGSFAFPRADWPWPYGMGDLPGDRQKEAHLRRYLATPLTVYLGQADDDPAADSGNFDASPAANQQGVNRLERGRNFYEYGRMLARRKGWEFGWEKVEVPGVGHEARLMINHLRMAEALGLPNKAP